MLKKEIRKEYKSKRNLISASDQLKWDDLLLIQFQALGLPFIRYVLSYYPIEENKEINTFIITDYLQFRNPNLAICYPRIDMETLDMEAVICHADSIFEINAWNIPEPVDTMIAEPAQLDMVLIPLLAIDLQGTRVGYGKGFYDRYLKNVRKDCLKIGFSYFAPVRQVDDRDDFDVPLDICITPERTYVF